MQIYPFVSTLQEHVTYTHTNTTSTHTQKQPHTDSHTHTHTQANIYIYIYNLNIRYIILVSSIAMISTIEKHSCKYTYTYICEKYNINKH